MSLYEVNALRWDNFVQTNENSSLEMLATCARDPSSGLHSGLSLFKPVNERSATAFSNRTLARDGSRLTLNDELANDAVKISQALLAFAIQGLDVVQSLLIRHLMATAKPSSDMLKLAKQEYFRQRIHMLKCIYRLVNGSLVESNQLCLNLKEAVELLYSKGVIQDLSDEFMRQLTAMLAPPRSSQEPLTGGEEELHLLLDITMVHYRLKNCSRKQLVDLIQVVKNISAEGGVSPSLYTKLSFLVMLGFGFWKLLTIETAENHPLYSDFMEIDGNFCSWAMEDVNPQKNTLIFVCWNLFRRTLLDMSESDISPNSPSVDTGAIDVQSIPDFLRFVAQSIGGLSCEHLCRECLLMLMDACLKTRGFLSDMKQAMIVFKVLKKLCDRDAYICRAVWTKPVHHSINNLIESMSLWVPLNPLPLATLLPAFCIPEMQDCLRRTLQEKYSGAIVYHHGEDLRYLRSFAENKSFIAAEDFRPVYRRHFKIPVGTRGFLFKKELPEWIVPRNQPNELLIEWTGLSFVELFISQLKFCLGEFVTDENRTKHLFTDETNQLLHLTVRLMETCPSLKLSHRCLGDQTIKALLVRLVARKMENRQNLSDELKLLKQLCFLDPLRTCDILYTSRFLTDENQAADGYMERALAMKTKHSIEIQLEMVGAILELMTAFVAQRTIVTKAVNSVAVIISRYLLPELKKPSNVENRDQIETVYLRIGQFFNALIALGPKTLGAKKAFERVFLKHFCLEDLVLGIVRLLPEKSTQCTVTQLRLVSEICDLLSALLNDKNQFGDETVTKIVLFLIKRGYWDQQTPAARLLIHITAFFAPEPRKILDNACTASCFRFLAVLLRQFWRRRDRMENIRFCSTLPTRDSALVTEFHGALLFETQTHQSLISWNVFNGTKELLMAASETDPEFFDLVATTGLSPHNDSVSASLVTIFWRVVALRPETIRRQPMVFHVALQGLSALQLSHHEQGRRVWNVFSKNSFNLSCLLEIALGPWIDPDETLNESTGSLMADLEGHCKSMAMGIIAHELKGKSKNEELLKMLLEAGLLNQKWPEWHHSLENATRCAEGSLTDFSNTFAIVANFLAYEIVILLMENGDAVERVMCVPWAAQLKQVVTTIVSSKDMTLAEAVENIHSLRTSTTLGLEYWRSLHNLKPGYEFLKEELQPGNLLLKIIMSELPSPQSMAADISFDLDSYIKRRLLTPYIAGSCEIYPFFLDLFKESIRCQQRSVSVRAPALMSWMQISEVVFQAAIDEKLPTGEDRLQNVLDILGDRCVDWIAYCSDRIGELKFPDDQSPAQYEFYLLQDGLGSGIHLSAALTESLMKLANLIPRFSNAAESQRQSTPSSSPQVPHQISLPYDQETYLSSLPIRSLWRCLKMWYKRLPEWNQQPRLMKYKENAAKTTIFLTIIAGHIATRAIPERLTHFDTVLEGMTRAMNPEIMSIPVANVAMVALVRIAESIKAWAPEWIAAVHHNLRFEKLLEAARESDHEQENNLRNTATTKDVCLWSLNLLHFGISVAKHPQLHSIVLGSEVMSQLSLYLYHLSRKVTRRRSGDDAESEAVSRFNEKQWCLALKLSGEVVGLSSSEQMPYRMEFFDTAAGMLFQSFHRIIGRHVGRYHDPLTLERLQQMIAALDFLVSAHDVFASSSLLLMDYPKRRRDVMEFLHRCDRICHRQGTEFFSKATSREDRLMIQEPFMSTCGDLSWFDICKNGMESEQAREIDATASSLAQTHPSTSTAEKGLSVFCWKMGRDIFHSISLALEYLAKSPPNAEKYQTGSEDGSLKELMLRLQTTVMSTGGSLSFEIMSKQVPAMKSEIQQFSWTLVRIVSLTENFLSDCGVNRRRRQQEAFNNQMETMRHFLIDYRTA